MSYTGLDLLALWAWRRMLHMLMQYTKTMFMVGMWRVLVCARDHACAGHAYGSMCANQRARLSAPYKVCKLQGGNRLLTSWCGQQAACWKAQMMSKVKHGHDDMFVANRKCLSPQSFTRFLCIAANRRWPATKKTTVRRPPG